MNREKRPPQARQELQGAEPGGDLPETPAAPLPDPEAATAPCPRMSSLDGTVTWGEAPRVPSTQERGRAGRHRPGSLSSVQPAGTDVSCVPGCTEQAWPQGTSVPLWFCPRLSLSAASGSSPRVLWMDSLDWGLEAFENRRPPPRETRCIRLEDGSCACRVRLNSAAGKSQPRGSPASLWGLVSQPGGGTRKTPCLRDLPPGFYLQEFNMKGH